MKLRKQHSKEVSRDEDFQDQDHVAAFEVADWAPNAGQIYRGFALRNVLRSELQRLSPGLRVVFVLRDVEGCRSSGRRKFLS
jgi:DNA-directed RNA polymerase specialized sigma24 family protein